MTWRSPEEKLHLNGKGVYGQFGLSMIASLEFGEERKQSADGCLCD